MPDLANLLNPSSLKLVHCPNLKSVSDQCESSSPLNSDITRTLSSDDNFRCSWDERLRYPVLQQPEVSNGNEIRVFKRRRGKKPSVAKTLDVYVKEWVASKILQGVSEEKCYLPFLVGAPKLVIFYYCLFLFSYVIVCPIYLIDWIVGIRSETYCC